MSNARSRGMARNGSTQLVADFTRRGSTQSQGVEEFKDLGSGGIDGLRDGGVVTCDVPLTQVPLPRRRPKIQAMKTQALKRLV